MKKIMHIVVLMMFVLSLPMSAFADTISDSANNVSVSKLDTLKYGVGFEIDPE